MRFHSGRIAFREYTKEDFTLFYSIFSDEQIMKYAYIDRYQSEEEIMPYFNEVTENSVSTENRKGYTFALFSIADGNYIGFADIEIQYMKGNGGFGEIGYFLKPECWGFGYASEVAASLIEVCFKYLKLHRVTARCNSNNHKSERVMQKAGMAKEGEFRKVRYKEGRWDNEMNYSILVEEWEDKRLVLDMEFNI
jgi:ribosomal-protein-alanine N-acetyltransferase